MVCLNDFCVKLIIRANSDALFFSGRRGGVPKVPGLWKVVVDDQTFAALCCEAECGLPSYARAPVTSAMRPAKMRMFSITIRHHMRQKNDLGVRRMYHHTIK
jgi:hypothetical protein